MSLVNAKKYISNLYFTNSVTDDNILTNIISGLSLPNREILLKYNYKYNRNIANYEYTIPIKELIRLKNINKKVQTRILHKIIHKP